jgi:hypothetical protein
MKKHIHMLYGHGKRFARVFSLILLSACASASLADGKPRESDPCGRRTRYDGTVFTLTISRSFHLGATTIKLCARQDAEENFLLVRTHPFPVERNHVWKDRQIKLDSGLYERIVQLYEKALDYNVKDDTIGFDGSSWCLETRRGFTYSKACFWSPDNEPQQRGIVGLYQLGKELWSIAELEPEIGELY